MPPITFFVCVEAGVLEPYTVRLVRSLRRFGGRFAGCPVVAVMPRPLYGLTADTRRALRDADVRLVDARGASPFPWFDFYNKPAGLAAIERLLDTDVVAFLDSDVLVLRPPDLLDLPAGVDFAACPSQSSGATTGPADPNHAYWRAVAKLFGLDIDAFPTVRAFREGHDMHLYWNAGVFAFRRSTGFIPAYVEACRRVLTCGLKSPVAGLFYTDQVVLPLVVRQLKLNFRHLPLAYNHSLHLPAAKYAKHGLTGPGDDAFWRELTVLHYHRSMAEAFGEMVSLLTAHHREAGAWLAGEGPIAWRQDVAFKAVNRLRALSRKRRLDRFVAGCAVPG